MSPIELLWTAKKMVLHCNGSRISGNAITEVPLCANYLPELLVIVGQPFLSGLSV